jgi:endonuclease III-like uncharacterized protein
MSMFKYPSFSIPVMAKKPLKDIYACLLKIYHPQGWWPIINSKTLLCEYHTNAPNNEEERFEIIVGAILTQNTRFRQ